MIKVFHNQYFIRLLSFVFVSTIPSIASAQRWSETNFSKDSTTINIKVAYLATIKHPGLAFGVEFPISKKVFLKNEKIEKTKEQFLTTDFSFYHHETFHSNYLLSIGYLRRRTNSHNWYFDFEPQIGINRTFLDGTSYQVDNNGNVSQDKLAGFWYLNTQFAFSVGKDFSKQKKPLPISVFIRPNLLLMLPYNNFIYARPTVELGSRITHPKFLKKQRSVKQFNRNFK